MYRARQILGRWMGLAPDGAQGVLRVVGLVVLVGVLVSGIAASGTTGLDSGLQVQAVPYSDVVRFVVQGEGVTTLKVEILDLTGRRLFDSGPIAGNVLDWPMTTESGERVAQGVYLYAITAWDGQGKVLEQKTGKLALVPGSMGLGQAPALISQTEREPISSEPQGAKPVPLTQHIYDALQVNGGITSYTGFGTVKTVSTTRGTSGRVGADYDGFYFSSDTPGRAFKILTNPGSGITTRLWVAANGNVGIGTTSPSAALEVHGSTTNLFALYDPADPSSPKFKVEKDGDVYADRSYNCGLASGCFNAGSGADVAERINVSGTVEPGDVVEIDSMHLGLYRRAREPYSTRVAGVISAAPAITLGNNFDAQADKWTDSRPLLALAGRVPVKATTENGPINIGDFLTTSSKPGYAMRCADLGKCTGAILGKALEPLEEGIGVIMVQVTLR